MQNSLPMDRAAGRALPAGGRFAATARTLMAWLAERRAVARVEAELGAHSDRELADLGMSRADIPAVARGSFQRRR